MSFFPSGVQVEICQYLNWEENFNFFLAVDKPIPTQVAKKLKHILNVYTRQLERKIVCLEYAPGGPVYMACKASFESQDYS